MLPGVSILPAAGVPPAPMANRDAPLSVSTKGREGEWEERQRDSTGPLLPLIQRTHSLFLSLLESIRRAECLLQSQRPKNKCAL